MYQDIHAYNLHAYDAAQREMQYVGTYAKKRCARDASTSVRSQLEIRRKTIHVCMIHEQDITDHIPKGPIARNVKKSFLRQTNGK